MEEVEESKQFVDDSPFKGEVAEAHTNGEADIEEDSRYPCIFTGCDRIFYENDMLEPQKNDNEVPIYVCSWDSCTKEFTNLYHLRRHQRIHTGERPYICPHCDKAFTRQDHAKLHLKSHYDDGRELPSADIVTNKVEKSPVKYQDQAEKPVTPVTCQRCNKHFSRMDHLKRHMKMNLGCRKLFKGDNETAIDVGKPYICPHCDQGFNRKDHLVRHIKMHLFRKEISKRDSEIVIEQEKPYICPHCDKEFAVKDRLKTHVRVHMVRQLISNGENSEAAHEIVNSDSEVAHEIVNPDTKVAHEIVKPHRRVASEIIKPFACPYCKKCFTRPYTVKQHVVKHFRGGQDPLTKQQRPSFIDDGSGTITYANHNGSATEDEDAFDPFLNMEIPDGFHPCDFVNMQMFVMELRVERLTGKQCQKYQIGDVENTTDTETKYCEDEAMDVDHSIAKEEPVCQ